MQWSILSIAATVVNEKKNRLWNEENFEQTLMDATTAERGLYRAQLVAEECCLFLEV